MKHFTSWLTLCAFVVLARSLDAQSAMAAGARKSDSLGASNAWQAKALTLSMLMDSVGANHPLVAASRAHIRAAEAARTTAGLFGNPVFGFEIDNTPFPGSGHVTLPPGMERESMTTATFPLEPIYQRGARVRRADAEVRAVRADAFGERQRLARNAAHAFYRTALAQVGVDVSRDLATWFDTLVAYNKNRVDQGATAEADLIRSQLERDRTFVEETMQEAELARARAELSSFLGDSHARGDSVVRGATSVDAGSTPLPLSLVTIANEGVGTPESAPQGVDTADSTNATGLARRPDVLAARERVSASRAAIATERTMLVRQLGATIGVKQSGGMSTMIAGVSFPIPLFDQNRGEVARAGAEREAAAYELTDRVRTANAEIEGDQEAAQLLTDRMLLLAGPPANGVTNAPPSFLTRADEARRIALGAYREGAVPLIQVLDAARAWGESRMTFYRTLYEQHESVLDLLTAKGMDLRDAVSASPLNPGSGSIRHHSPTSP